MAMDGTWLYYFDEGKTKLEANFVEGVCTDALYWDENGVETKWLFDSTGMFIPDGDFRKHAVTYYRG